MVPIDALMMQYLSSVLTVKVKKFNQEQVNGWSNYGS